MVYKNSIIVCINYDTSIDVINIETTKMADRSGRSVAQFVSVTQFVTFYI